MSHASIETLVLSQDLANRLAQPFQGNPYSDRSAIAASRNVGQFCEENGLRCFVKSQQISRVPTKLRCSYFDLAGLNRGKIYPYSRVDPETFDRKTIFFKRGRKPIAIVCAMPASQTAEERFDSVKEVKFALKHFWTAEHTNLVFLVHSETKIGISAEKFHQDHVVVQ